MNPVLVVVVLKGCEFSLQVAGIPEKEMVEVLPANGSDQAPNKMSFDGPFGPGLPFLPDENRSRYLCFLSNA